MELLIVYDLLINFVLYLLMCLVMRTLIIWNIFQNISVSVRLLLPVSYFDQPQIYISRVFHVQAAVAFVGSNFTNRIVYLRVCAHHRTRPTESVRRGFSRTRPSMDTDLNEAWQVSFNRKYRKYLEYSSDKSNARIVSICPTKRANTWSFLP